MISKNIFVLLNIHVLLWLVKDLSWLMQWKSLGVFIMIPAVLFAVLIAYKSRDSLVELLPNLAVVFWIIANSIWMMVEFFAADESLKFYAIIPFICGIIAICSHFLLKIKLDRK
jgi:hypothetical protein